MALSFFSCSTNKKKKKKENMRISDLLTKEEEEEEHEDQSSYTRKRSSSPSMLSRWFSKKRLTDPNPDPPVESDKVLSAPGGKRKELSFNLGMGIGLGFFLAKSVTQVNKMTELRAQMDMLLKEARTEIRTKTAITSSSKTSNNIFDAISSSSGSSDNFSISPSRYCRDTNICNASYDLKRAKCEANDTTTIENSRSATMNQMEAELELELERLEMDLGGKSSSVQQHRKELENEKDDSSFESFSFTGGEDIDIVPRDICDYGGVPAHELERRLHELLEARQQERILELQSALQCMEEKLREKEIELRTWKEAHECLDLQNGEAPIS